jgi:hypothetical protein
VVFPVTFCGAALRVKAGSEAKKETHREISELANSVRAISRYWFFFSFSSPLFVLARLPEGVGQKQHPLLLTPLD